MLLNIPVEEQSLRVGGMVMSNDNIDVEDTQINTGFQEGPVQQGLQKFSASNGARILDGIKYTSHLIDEHRKSSGTLGQCQGLLQGAFKFDRDKYVNSSQWTTNTFDSPEYRRSELAMTYIKRDTGYYLRIILILIVLGLCLLDIRSTSCIQNSEIRRRHKVMPPRGERGEIAIRYY